MTRDLSRELQWDKDRSIIKVTYSSITSARKYTQIFANDSIISTYRIIPQAIQLQWHRLIADSKTASARRTKAHHNTHCWKMYTSMNLLAFKSSTMLQLFSCFFYNNFINHVLNSHFLLIICFSILVEKKMC